MYQTNNPVTTSTFPKYYVKRNKTQQQIPLSQSVDPTTTTSRDDESNEANTKEESLPFPSSYSITNFLAYQKVSPQYKSFLAPLHQTLIPKTVGETPKHRPWREAMNEVMGALVQNHTWDIVQKPIGKILVGCRWVFTIKYRSDGTLERYKARLVAKVYTQTYDIYYKETSAPVAKMNTIRILISLIVNLD